MIFCRFFVLRYRFLIFFVFVLLDGQPVGWWRVDPPVASL
jgi:hypothetical protein